MAFALWQGADHCSGSATPGAKALMKWCLDNHPAATNLGIYNCRPVRGGSSLSCHSEGRAIDVGFPMSSGKGSAAGYDLVHQVRPRAAALGVQAIIYDRTIWSAKSPGPRGRYYGGANPHYDHVHIELTRGAARTLTLATVRHVLGPVVSVPMGTLTKGTSGAAVAILQRALKVTADGQFGEETLAALNTFKAKHGLPADGVAGPAVRRLLGLRQ